MAGSWVNVTGTTQTIAANTGYIANNAGLVTLTLPASPTIGDYFMIVGYGAGGWRIAQNASQKIVWDAGGVAGTNETTAGTGGHMDSNDRYDAVEVINTATNIFTVAGAKGNLSLT